MLPLREGQCLHSMCRYRAGDSQQWEMCVHLNLTAPMLLTQAFAAGMEKKKVRI